MFQDLLNEWFGSETYKQDIIHNVSTDNMLMDFAVWLDTRSPTLRAPANADGAYCMCEKPLDDDGWRCIRCGKLLSPRHGG